jgi:hypothetical protein
VERDVAAAEQLGEPGRQALIGVELIDERAVDRERPLAIDAEGERVVGRDGVDEELGAREGGVATDQVELEALDRVIVEVRGPQDELLAQLVEAEDEADLHPLGDLASERRAGERALVDRGGLVLELGPARAVVDERDVNPVLALGVGVDERALRDEALPAFGARDRVERTGEDLIANFGGADCVHTVGEARLLLDAAVRARDGLEEPGRHQRLFALWMTLPIAVYSRSAPRWR